MDCYVDVHFSQIFDVDIRKHAKMLLNLQKIGTPLCTVDFLESGFYVDQSKTGKEDGWRVKTGFKENITE